MNQIVLKWLYAITNSEHSFGPFADGWTDQRNDHVIEIKKNVKNIKIKKNNTPNDHFIKFEWCWTI